MLDVITGLDESFLRAFENDILGRIPEEKLQAGLRQARNARILQQAGSVHIPGVGQKIAEIDARLYFRMQHDFGSEENWLQDFLADNPELCAKGYKPKTSRVRKGKTFINGQPV
tara:strand:- start:752 stop:1093 length:342 start_codon:yes stop_codon:yes gene_type:complete